MRNDPAFATRRLTPPIDYTGVPAKFQPPVSFDHEGRLKIGEPRVSAVCRSITDCEELVRWFGDAEFMPYLPILLLIPGHPKLLVGLGYASAAELRDDAVNLWGKYTERIAKQGHSMRLTGDEMREKFGLARREDVTNMTAEAFHERIKRHKASPITDPFRQPNYPRVRGKTVHTVAADPAPWKDN